MSSEGEILTYECEELDITTQAVENKHIFIFRAYFYCLFQVSSEGEILTYECEELDITTQAVDD